MSPCVFLYIYFSRSTEKITPQQRDVGGPGDSTRNYLVSARKQGAMFTPGVVSTFFPGR